MGATLSINGEIKKLGAGAAVLGLPAHSIAMLTNMLVRKGEKVRKGDVILTGGITSAVQLSNGDFVSGKFDGLDEVTFTVTDILKRSIYMPIINIQLLEGRPKEKIEEVIYNITNTVSETLDAPKESIRVIVTEIPKSNWGIAGVPVSKR